jgi:membrane protease YdiL (CAAX protease family)
MLVGPGLKSGLRRAQYEARNDHGLLRTVAYFVLGLLVLGLMQLLAGFFVSWLMGGGFLPVKGASTETQLLRSQGVVLGLFPANILSVAIVYWLARLRGQNASQALALTNPRLGILGWIAVVIAFFVVVSVSSGVILYASNVNPLEYVPTADSVTDPNRQGGLIEATLASLAIQPVLFSLALFSTIVGAPVLEEVLFRGALFSAIRQSSLGSLGAILITSTLWAMIHAGAAPWMFVGLIFVMGLVLGILLMRFGSLWVPIICHCLWNTVTSFNIFWNVTGG